MPKEKKEITKKFKKTKSAKHNNEILALLKEEDDIDLRGKHGETALHWASYHANVSLIEALLEQQADIDAQDDENRRTPLMWAALRILHDVTRYTEVINLLTTRDADVSIRDHKGNNIYDILSGINNFQRQIKFTDKFKLDSTHAFFNEGELPENNNDQFAQNGDDSSDEEITKISEYNIVDNWNAFSKSNAYKELTQLGINVRSIKLLFVLHAEGLKCLYHKNVNQYYYHSRNGKKFLGQNSITNPKNIVPWIEKALSETIKAIIYYNELTTDDKNQLDRLVKDNDESSGLARELAENIQLLLRAADLRNAMYNVGKFYLTAKDGIKKEVKKLRKEDNSLKGQKGNTVVLNNFEQLSPGVAKYFSPTKTTKNNSSYLRRCIIGLKQRIGLPTISVPKELLSEKSSTQAESDKSDAQALINYFVAYFFFALKTYQKEFSIEIRRGQNEGVIFDFSEQHHTNSINWFSSVRRTNRFQTRKLKHHEEKHFLHKNNGKTTVAKNIEDTKVKFGYYIHHHSFWKLPSGSSVLFKEEITTNQLRNSHVTFSTTSKTTYPELSSKISEHSSTDENYSDNLAVNMQNLMQGVVPKSTVDTFTCELTYLIFFCETSRNPAAFIVHQMMLDLRLGKKVTWNELFSLAPQNGGGRMPMSMVEAVSCAGYLQKLFAPYMPYPYMYGGSDDCDKTKLTDFIQRNTYIVEQWLQLTKKELHENILMINIFSIYITEAEWYDFSEFQETELTPLTASLTLSATTADGAKPKQPLPSANKPNINTENNPTTDALNRNADNQRDKQTYLLQAHDINDAADIMLRNNNKVHFIPVQQNHLDDHSGNLTSALVTTAWPELENNKSVVSIFNINNTHWVAFKIVKSHKESLIIYYKDSNGDIYPKNFTDSIEKAFNPPFNLEFVHSETREQHDGVNCGIFALRNLEILSSTDVFPTEKSKDKLTIFSKSFVFYTPTNSSANFFKQERIHLGNLYKQRSEETAEEAKKKKLQVDKLDALLATPIITALQNTNVQIKNALTDKKVVIEFRYNRDNNDFRLCIYIRRDVTQLLPLFEDILTKAQIPFTKVTQSSSGTYLFMNQAQANLLLNNLQQIDPPSSPTIKP